ncbi:MAG: alpha/beta hydrolase [Pseudomonadales bacterium]|nr:alpha/beta hydrolase [Pseudomonadales bacterium]
MSSVWSSATTFRLGFYSILAVVIVLLMNGCSSYFFYPMKRLVRTPDQVGLNYRDIEVTTSDQVRIHGWLLPAEQPRGIVFFLHGNAENISTHLASVYWLPEQGYEVLLMDYRGYGRSEGSPDFPEVYQDVAAMYQWLQTYARERQLPVYILGQSLGGVISSYYFSQLPAEQRVFEGVVLDAVFAGHRDIARDVLRRSFITWPLQFVVPPFLPAEYDPADHVADFSPTPLLFFHSPDDEIIPYDQGRSVYEQAKPPKYWVRSHGPHIATFDDPAYRQLLLNFLARPGADPSAKP